MSEMNGNPHYAQLDRGYDTSNPDYAATVQTEAILALSYEQRTANLLAVYESVLCDTLNGAERLALEKTILARTGIKYA